MENMATMARAEAATDREYDRFVRSVERILGCDILDGSDEEGTCDDLCRDGATPAEAAQQIRAEWQAAAEVRAESRAERCLSPGYGS